MENLGIDYKLLLAQVLNFALFFYIYKRFIAQPFLKFMKKEKKKNEERETLLESLKKQRDDLLKEESFLKAKIRREAAEVIKQAKEEGEKVRQEIIAQARKEAEEVRRTAQKQIKEEKIVMEKEVQKKIALLGVAIVRKALNQYLTEEMKKQITRNILKNLDQKNLEYEN